MYCVIYQGFMFIVVYPVISVYDMCFQKKSKMGSSCFLFCSFSQG